jgi:large subunit ribosomal protein L17
MLRNMVTSLLGNERIQTTLAKAKEVRKLTDKVIGLAKRGDLHARRQALAILPDKGVVKKLFSEIGPRYQDRAGGFTRIVRVGNRLGDAAPMSVVMLTEAVVPEGTEKKKSKKAPSKKKTTGGARSKKKAEKAKEEKPEKKAKGKGKAKQAAVEPESKEAKETPKRGRTEKKGETK